MTLRRIRNYSTLIAVVVWTMWAVDVSRPGPVDRAGKIKGTDFLQFYVGGSFVREGRLADFYDVRMLHARAEALVPESRDIFYLPIQSPQTALAFAPIAALPYSAAFLVWIAAILALYGASCWLIWRECHTLHRHLSAALPAMIAFPGLYSTVLHGQTSAVALLIVVLMLVALRRGRAVAAGLTLGVLAFKPHWWAAGVAIFVVAREWKIVAAAVASAAAQIAATWVIGGAAATVGYARVLVSVQRVGDLLEPRPGDSLRSLFKVFVPFEPASLVLYGCASLLVACAAARIWRSEARFELRASAVVIAVVLVSPHAFAYDLVLLTPVFLLLANLIADGAAEAVRPPMAWSLCALFIAPLLAVFPAAIRLQFSATAMLVALAAVDRLVRWHRHAPECPPRGRAPQSHAIGAPTPDAATTAPGFGRAYTGVPPAAERARWRPATR